ncbi:MAG: PCRF domain-containing protein, partial [Armatimonadetes bacterium]|nr:PCRF domain-containing protein [Armatimonadota bacterium]
PIQVLGMDSRGQDHLELIEVPAEEDSRGPEAAGAEDLENVHDQENVLGLCGMHLTAEGTWQRLGSAVRRDDLVEQMLTTLAGERQNSLLLVGNSDVGKTALVHEVARRLAEGRVPENLVGRQLWSVTANNLIAGMKYIGEWQGRTQKLIQQVRRGRQIVYMGDPTEILDAGRWSESDNNMGRFLRPYLENGELVLILEASPETAAAESRREPSFFQAFRRLEVLETNDVDTLAILNAAARRLETEHPVRVEPSALGALFDLTRRFMPYRAFPGKAARLLDQMVRDLGGVEGSEVRTLGRPDAIAAFTRATGLPELLLSDEAPLRVPDVRTHFAERLLGQPDAVDSMVDLITVLKAGLNDPQKPLGSFFFVGPTGVGKTEMAKVLAEFLFGSRDRMVRFDMSEYAAADALPRLIGSAWQRDDQGELTRRVREQPFCVVLLDEVEKAHPEVFDALLSVLGEGRLTDPDGRTTDFRNAIVIMTSNLGASRRELQSIGFGRPGEPEASVAALRAHFIKEAEAFFRPEFFNRMDRIVIFRPLTPEAMRQITRRELGKLLMREGIVRRNLLVEVEDPVIEQLLQQGFHARYGARPLQREIEKAVILPLARLLVDQEADHRHLIRFSCREGKIHLTRVVVEEPEETAAEGVRVGPSAERRPEPDAAELLRRSQALRDLCAAEDAGAVVQALRRETEQLLARTREPTFWDEADTARDVLRQIYHLERVLKRLDNLAERSERLEERIQQARRHRDRRQFPRLGEECEELEAALSYLQLELVGAASGAAGDQVLLRFLPLGSDRDEDAELWPARLLHMYSAWAERKGYEYEPLSAEAAAGAAGRDAERLPSPAPGRYLMVKGPNVYRFLQGESGLHKLTQGTGEERSRLLARVEVAPLTERGERPGSHGSAGERD